MSILSTLADWFVPKPPDLQERSDFPSMADQIAAIRRTQAQERVWRPAAVNEALGVPSILSAVSLISGVAGSLSMEGYRDGSLMLTDTPRLIQRPNPRSTPGVFIRDTVFYRATRGEFWWWIANRDTDGNATALYPVPPWEITVTANPNDRLRPEIKWGDRVMPNDDMRQSMYLPGPDGLRGVGPLQLAGAAVSVATEASHWAASFFSGNLPSLIGTTDQDVDELDLKALDEQWAEKQGNTPRWLTNGLKLEAPPYDAVKAQLTESRQFQVGEVARMFLIPGPLLEYQMSGSSLTYRNEEDIWTDFQRRCLSPQYLEPIEQEMSDLMPRTTVGRFNLEQLLRADIKTRYDTWKVGIDGGFLTSDEARKKEGLAPGNVDFAPVPFSPPAADLPAIPQNRSILPGNCSKCNKHLADSAPPGWSTTCPRCKTVNSIPLESQERSTPDAMVAAITALANREPPQVTVNPAPVTFEAGAFQIPPPDLTPLTELATSISELASRPQPETNFTVNPAEVHVPPQDSFVTAIQDLKEMMEKPRNRRVVRDENGHIIALEEVA